MPKLVKPSLVIGLGSTGCQVVLALLRRLKQDPQPLPNCQFLLLDDTPLSAYWSEQREREGPRLVATFLQLGDRPAHTRAAARAACAAQAEVISRSIANAFAEMTAVSHRDALRARDLILDTRNADFYLLASLSGVLGSGCFLDVAYLVRDFMQRRRVNHTVKGFLLLPDVLASGDPVLREARAYAALRELDFLTERGQFAATYSDRLSVRVNDRPFDLCFLLDQTNEEGFNLGDPEAFYRVVAEICYTLLTTPVGRELDTALETLTVPPRYLDGKLGAYSSIGYSALIFPAQRAADYFSHRLAAELAGEVLLRSRENRGETERRLREFVARWNLRREDGAELEEAVLQAASGVEAFSLPPPPSFAEVPPEHLLTVIDTYYAELEGKRRAAEETPPAPTDPVEQELQRLKEQQARRQEGEVESLPPSLAQIEQQLLEMSREVERDLLAQIRALLDEPLTAGVRGTLTFLRQLQERLQTLRNRLTQRVQQRRNELPQKRKQVQQRRAALARSLQTVPSPLAQVGRAFLLWFVLVYALTAGLEFLFAQGYLTSPPLLAKIFAVGGEEVQNVLAALLLLTGFALHSALTCERSRTWVIRQRTRYVASRHDLLVAELGVRTAEAARVLVQRLSRVVQAYQEAVTAYRERLTRVHQTLQQEAEALREKLFQRHCVLEEAICTEDDYERLYREFVPQLEPVATALAQNHGPLHVWTRWEEGEVAARLREFALARLEAVRRLSAEDVINRQAEHLPPLQRLEQLYSAASPLLRFTDVHLRGAGQVLALDLLGLSQPNRSALARLAEELRRSTVVVETEERERIVALRTKNALPLYALAMIGGYRDRYERLRTQGETPLHTRGEYLLLPDFMPESLISLNPELHRALVVGLAFGLVERRELEVPSTATPDPKSLPQLVSRGLDLARERLRSQPPSQARGRKRGIPPPTRAQVYILLPVGGLERETLLGHDVQECVDYLQAHPQVIAALQKAIGERVEELTPPRARAHLEHYLGETLLSEAAQKRLREYLERLEKGEGGKGWGAAN